MSIDLLILMLISTSMLDLTPFHFLFAGNNPFTFYSLMMAYMYIKYMGFSFRSGIARHLVPIAFVYVSIFLSFIPAYVFYGQHLYHSLVVYRRALCFLCFPLLMSIRPTLRECRNALYAFSFLYAFFSFVGTYLRPGWIPVPDGMEYIINTDILTPLSGLHYVGISLVFSLDQYRSTHKRKYLELSLFLFLIIFLVQNRTILLASGVVIIAAVLFDLPARSRISAEVILAFFLVAVAVLGWEFISGLYDETSNQLQNEDYNRVKAFHYFTSVKNGLLSFFLGDGFISGNVHSHMSDLRMEGIYHSDLGLIGLWNQFGLLFPLSVLYYNIRGCSKDHSFYVRGLSMMMIVSGLTMAYYFTYASITWLCLYYYFSESDERYFLRRKERRDEIARRKIEKVKSLAR